MPTTGSVDPSTKISWRDQIEIHPAALKYRRMSDQELDELSLDIKKNNIKVPIIFYVDPDKTADKKLLLDGVSRLDAAERAGVLVVNDGKLRLRTRYGLRDVPERIVADVDPYASAASYNAYRRHLTPKEKRERIAEALKADPGKSDNSIAKQTGSSDKTVNKVRRTLEANSDIPNKTERIEKTGRKARGRQPGEAAPARPMRRKAKAAAERLYDASRQAGIDVIGSKDGFVRDMAPLLNEAKALAQFNQAFADASTPEPTPAQVIEQAQVDFVEKYADLNEPTESEQKRTLLTPSKRSKAFYIFIDAWDAITPTERPCALDAIGLEALLAAVPADRWPVIADHIQARQPLPQSPDDDCLIREGGGADPQMQHPDIVETLRILIALTEATTPDDTAAASGTISPTALFKLSSWLTRLATELINAKQVLADDGIPDFLRREAHGGAHG